MALTHFAVVSAAFTRPLSSSNWRCEILSSWSHRMMHSSRCSHRRGATTRGRMPSTLANAPSPSFRRRRRDVAYPSAAGFCPASSTLYTPRDGRGCINPHRLQSTRLFGSKPGSPNARPGQILLSDDRDDTSTTPIDMAALHRTVETTREIIGYPTFDVSLSLVDDDYMKEINEASRGVNKPTDVLSFCFQENFVEPGVLGEVQFDVSDFYCLGDMMIDVDYVRRRCEEDRKLHAEEGRLGGIKDGKVVEGEVVSEQVNSDSKEDEGEDEDGEYEYIEVDVGEYDDFDFYDDRGVAPAMQYVYDPEVRIHMLIVHGMLHLVGYDHIEDDDYELMVVREDEVLAELKSRLGENFGLAKALPEA